MSTAHKRKPLHKNGAWGQRKTALPAWRPCEKDHGSHHTSLRLTPAPVHRPTNGDTGKSGQAPWHPPPPLPLQPLSVPSSSRWLHRGLSMSLRSREQGRVGLGGWEPGFTHSNAAVSPPTGPLPDCAYLGVSLDSPGPRFPCLSSGEGDITHSVGLWWGVDGSGCGASLAGTRRALQNQVLAVPTANSG